MIKITLKNSTVVNWDNTEYSDYTYDGKFFIISKNGERVGFYNLDFIIAIIIK